MMLNSKDVSGMYSKTGKGLYEKMHILRKKDEILNPDNYKKVLKREGHEMDKIVNCGLSEEQHFTDKIKALRASNEEVKPQVKSSIEEKNSMFRKKIVSNKVQPFDKMESRFHFFTQKV